MSAHRHTFVVPAYGISPYLEACVQSLQQQTEPGEVMITTSTPNSHIEHIAREFGVPCRVNAAGPRGIADDWNFAMAAAQTPWVTIAHQDDIYEPAYRRQLLDRVDQCTNQPLLIVFTGYRDMVNEHIRLISLNKLVKRMLLLPFVFKRCISGVKAKKRLIRWGSPICCPSVAYNREALGSFSFEPGYTAALDWLAWYQLAQREGGFLYVPQKLVRHRIHGENETTRQIKSGQRRNEELKLFEMMWGKRVAAFLSQLYLLGHRENL